MKYHDRRDALCPGRMNHRRRSQSKSATDAHQVVLACPDRFPHAAVPCEVPYANPRSPSQANALQSPLVEGEHHHFVPPPPAQARLRPKDHVLTAWLSAAGVKRYHAHGFQSMAPGYTPLEGKTEPH